MQQETESTQQETQSTQQETQSTQQEIKAGNPAEILSHYVFGNPLESTKTYNFGNIKSLSTSGNILREGRPIYELMVLICMEDKSGSQHVCGGCFIGEGWVLTNMHFACETKSTAVKITDIKSVSLDDIKEIGVIYRSGNTFITKKATEIYFNPNFTNNSLLNYAFIKIDTSEPHGYLGMAALSQEERNLCDDNPRKWYTYTYTIDNSKLSRDLVKFCVVNDKHEDIIIPMIKADNKKMNSANCVRFLVEDGIACTGMPLFTEKNNGACVVAGLNTSYTPPYDDVNTKRQVRIVSGLALTQSMIGQFIAISSTKKE